MLNNKLFFKEKTVKILLGLRAPRNKDKNISKMSKTSESSYLFYLKTIHKFRKAGLLEIEKKGRENLINLTNLGKDIADRLVFITKNS